MHQVAETVHGPIVSQCAGDHMAAYDVARAEAAAADDGEQFTRAAATSSLLLMNTI